MDRYENKKIAVIGGGHIGLALVEGLISSGKISGSQLVVANPSVGKIARLKKNGVEVTSDNKIAAREADWIFLAIKPLVVEQVLIEINPLVKGKLVISLAGAVAINSLKKYLKHAEIIRIMPNLAISCNQGIIGLFVDGFRHRQITQLLSHLGMVIEVDKEGDLDTLTLLSGCGPALVSQFMQMLDTYGVQHGLSSEVSRRLALQTFKGTTTLMESSGISPLKLIQSVATKGGITEAILNKLQHKRFINDFFQAISCGYVIIEKLRKAQK